jgi:hypothetical protein
MGMTWKIPVRPEKPLWHCVQPTGSNTVTRSVAHKVSGKPAFSKVAAGMAMPRLQWGHRQRTKRCAVIRLTLAAML